MKLSTLRRDWQAVHPGGNVWISLSNGELAEDGKQTGKFAVTYANGGKIYTYFYKSVYSLAERLNMLPDSTIDYWTESRKAIEALRAGHTYQSIGGLHDTMRHLLAQETGKDYRIKATESKDEYDRVIYTFVSMLEVE